MSAERKPPITRTRKDGTTWTSWGDANGPGKGPGHGPAKGSRPPFPPGNALHLTGGYRSPRVYGNLAEHLAAGLMDSRPDLGAYPEAVAAWATAEAQAALLRRHLNEVGTIDEKGEPRARTLEVLRAMERLAAKHRETLGLDPRSEAQLAKERAEAAHLAVDLGALAERGREAIQAREAAGIPAPPDLALETLERVKAEATPFDATAPYDPTTEEQNQ